MDEDNGGGAKKQVDIDFQSVFIYIPIVFLYVLLVVFSVGYASGSGNKFLPWTSVIVVSGALLIVATQLFSNVIRQGWIHFWIIAVDPDNATELQKNPAVVHSGTLDLIPAAQLFIMWLTLGILFRKYPTIEIASQVINALWLLWLAMLQLNGVRAVVPVRKSITIGFYLAMVFVPSENGIASRLAWYALLVKATMTYLLFILLSVEAASVRAIGPKKNNKKRRTRVEGYLASTESKVAQSAWVLLAPNIMLFAATLLAVALVWRIFRNSRTLEKKHDRNGKTRKETKKDKKKKKKRARFEDSDVETGSETVYVNASGQELVPFVEGGGGYGSADPHAVYTDNHGYPYTMDPYGNPVYITQQVYESGGEGAWE